MRSSYVPSPVHSGRDRLAQNSINTSVQNSINTSVHNSSTSAHTPLSIRMYESNNTNNYTHVDNINTHVSDTRPIPKLKSAFQDFQKVTSAHQSEHHKHSHHKHHNIHFSGDHHILHQDIESKLKSDFELHHAHQTYHAHQFHADASTYGVQELNQNQNQLNQGGSHQLSQGGLHEGQVNNTYGESSSTYDYRSTPSPSLSRSQSGLSLSKSSARENGNVAETSNALLLSSSTSSAGYPNQNQDLNTEYLRIQNQNQNQNPNTQNPSNNDSITRSVSSNLPRLPLQGLNSNNYNHPGKNTNAHTNAHKNDANTPQYTSTTTMTSDSYSMGDHHAGIVPPIIIHGKSRSWTKVKKIFLCSEST
jgi:hypothetical protein